MADPETRRRGEETRRKIMGVQWVDAPLPPNDPMADFGEFATEHVWSGAWARPGLDLRSRSLCTMTLMIAQKQGEELKAHAAGALRNGLFTQDELKEIVLHTAGYVGFPAARHAMQALRDLIMNGVEEAH